MIALRYSGCTVAVAIILLNRTDGEFLFEQNNQEIHHADLPHSLDLLLPLAFLSPHLRLDPSFHLLQPQRLSAIESHRVAN